VKRVIACVLAGYVGLGCSDNGTEPSPPARLSNEIVFSSNRAGLPGTRLL
jgi:hypothetical protein